MQGNRIIGVPGNGTTSSWQWLHGFGSRLRDLCFLADFEVLLLVVALLVVGGSSEAMSFPQRLRGLWDICSSNASFRLKPMAYVTFISSINWNGRIYRSSKSMSLHDILNYLVRSDAYDDGSM